MSHRSAINMGYIDFVFSVTDDAKLTLACSLENAGENVMISRSPDKVRTQGTRWHLRCMAFENISFGTGFGFSIGTKPISPIGQRFVGTLKSFSCKNNARRAGINKGLNPGGTCNLEAIASSDDIIFNIIFPATPDPRLGSNVKDVMATLHRFLDAVSVCEIPTKIVYFGRAVLAALFPPHDPNVIATSQTKFDDSLAKKATSTGDENARGFHKLE